MRYFLAIICCIIIVLRMLFPEILFDSTSLSIFVIAILVLLFPMLSKFIKGIRKIKIGNFELETKELAINVEKAEENVELVLDKSLPISDNNLSMNNFDINADNLRLSFYNVSTNIEKELNSISNFLIETDKKIPLSSAKLMKTLVDEGLIDKQILSVFRDFWDIRNKISHAHNSNFTDQELYSVIDSGTKILSLLRNEKNKLIVNNSNNYHNTIIEILEELNVKYISQQNNRAFGFDYTIKNNSNKDFIVEIKFWNINLDKSVINQLLKIIDIHKSDVILITNKELRNETYDYLLSIEKQLNYKIFVVVGQTKEALKSQLEMLLK